MTRAALEQEQQLPALTAFSRRKRCRLGGCTAVGSLQRLTRFPWTVGIQCGLTAPTVFTAPISHLAHGGVDILIGSHVERDIKTNTEKAKRYLPVIFGRHDCGGARDVCEDRGAKTTVPMHSFG